MEAVTGWDNFFLGQLGASAALGGLLFVSISINLDRILAFPHLPNRAMLAILLLLGVLIVSALMLVPGLPLGVAGGVTLAIALLVFGVGTYIEVRAARSQEDGKRAAFAVNVVLFVAAVVPYGIGGILLLLGDTGGVYWIAAAILFSIIKAVLDAWVLLVEIHR